MLKYARTTVFLVAAAVLVGCGAVEPDTTTTAQGTEPTTTNGSEQPTALTPTEPAPEGASTFQVDSSQSEVRFVIGEILGGQPNTVIGANQQVTGTAQVSFAAPGSSQLGEFQIESSGFRTDSSLRDRAINQFILQSGTFPTIVFAPTSMSGLPDAATTGDSFTVEITGALTIRDITQPVTFEVDLGVISDVHLQATGTATVSRDDYNLQIPQVPRVAGVDDQFILEFDLLLVAG